MFDRDSLVISYDPKRGEPRGSRSRGTDPRASGLGDCIDCTLCVQACPTGIDIRKGLQYECIACAACVDACNGVMDRMGYPRGLVRYTTQNSIDGRPSRVLRPRIFAYAGLLALLVGGFVVALALRIPLAMDVLHDRNALYRMVEDEQEVENVYTLRIMNRDSRDHDFTLGAEGLEGLEVEDFEDDSTLRVRAGEIVSIAARIRAPAGRASGGHSIRLVLTAVDAPRVRVTEKARFFGPLRAPGHDDDAHEG
jgi:cytochrome c oxidase accessory protein FixG